MSSPPVSRLLALLTFSALINYLDRQSLAVLLPVLREELQLTTSDYSRISSAFLIAYSLGQLVAGPTINRFGIRRTLALSVAVWSAASMLHGLAGTALELLALRVVLGVGESTNWPAGVKAIYLWAPTYRRALYLGVFDAGAAIGTASAFPLMALLTQWYGWRAAFVVIGASGFLWLLFWLPSAPAREAQPAPGVGVPWRELLRQPLLWGLVLTRFFATPVWWFYVFWLSDYLAVERGMTLMQLGLWGWLPYLSVDLGKIIGGRLSDYWSAGGKPFLAARRQVMAIGAVIMPLGVLAVTAPTVTMAVVWAATGTFGFGLWSVNILAIHADVFPERQIATAVGITTAAGGLGGAVFSWATGQIVSAAGYAHAFTLTAATAVLAYGILYAFTRGRREMAWMG